MKRYGFLFEKIVDIDNIKKAIKKASRGKKHKRSVQIALKDIDKTALKIQSRLVRGEWRPPKIHKAKIINDGIQLKKRIIVCPEFVREQCVHHAIMNVVYPLFIPKFYELSCGSIKGRGTVSAQRWISKKLKNERKTKYYAKADIKKFFQSLRPSLVFRELRKTIKDKKVLLLFSYILRSNYIMDKDNNIIRHGILIGFYTSPFFANLMLNSVDHLVKEKLKAKYYLRYMDDCLFIDSKKRKLKNILKEFKETVYKLKFKLKFVQIKQSDLIRFIGYIFKRNRTILLDTLFLKAKRCCKKIFKINHLSTYQARKVISYTGYFKNSNMNKAFVKYISPFVSVKACRKMVRNFDKKQARRTCYGIC